MKVLAAICFVVTLAQAFEFDWDAVKPGNVEPEALLGLFEKSAKHVPDTVDRITSGEEAGIGQFPYQVALLIENVRGSSFCGGSILSDEWILTAAHCVENAVSVEVVLGAHNIRQFEKNQIRIRASDIIVHERWNAATVKRDIAVIKLSKKVKFNGVIQPIRLAGRDQVGVTFANDIGIVSGWGRVTTSSSISSTLQWVSNPIISNGVCNLYYFGTIRQTQICLSARDGRSACMGDSGGALVVVGKDGIRSQVGVVSHGSSIGCQSGWPSVYTRVTSFLDWIAEKTGLDFN